MLGAFKNLWNSEKAVAVGMLVIAATVLTALGDMTIEQWTEYTKYLVTVYVGGKTIQGVTEAWANRTATHEASAVAQKVIEATKPPEVTSAPVPTQGGPA